MEVASLHARPKFILAFPHKNESVASVKGVLENLVEAWIEDGKAELYSSQDMHKGIDTQLLHKNAGMLTQLFQIHPRLRQLTVNEAMGQVLGKQDHAVKSKRRGVLCSEIVCEAREASRLGTNYIHA